MMACIQAQEAEGRDDVAPADDLVVHRAQRTQQPARRASDAAQPCFKRGGIEGRVAGLGSAAHFSPSR
jgi:hypothetical protein